MMATQIQLKWHHDRASGRHRLLTDSGRPAAALVEHDGDGQWDGYLPQSPLSYGPFADIKEAKQRMRAEANRALHGSVPRWGLGIPATDALLELAAWLAGMAQELETAADAGATPADVAAAHVHLGALEDVLLAARETPSTDPVRAARLLAAQPLVRQAQIERRHRSEPWREWLIRGGIKGIDHNIFGQSGPRREFAIVVARSANEATGAVTEIFRDEVYCSSPLQQIDKVTAYRSYDVLSAAPPAPEQDVTGLPRIDLRQPWRWPWRLAQEQEPVGNSMPGPRR